MNKAKKNSGNVLVSLAKKATTVSANTACAFLAYQSELPENAKKMRKF